MQNQLHRFDRFSKVVGEDNVKLLNKKCVLVLGVGGVGGYVVESLVRSGIGKFILVDFDVIDETNINRQIIALESTIGLKKVDVLEKRIKEINSGCEVIKIDEFIDKDRVKDLFNYDIDYFIDACDTMTTKKEIIKECIRRKIKFISSMGTGNKLDPSKLEIVDIRKTVNDPLAKIIRKFVDGDEELTSTYEIVDITADEFVYKKDADADNYVHYRVKEQFDIKGNYTYLNAAARVVPAEGKTALQLPEGFLFNGENTIPVESLNGERIIDASKAFFADATFAEDGKLNHTMNGEVKVKNYTLNGNNLVFNLYEGSDVYNINATSFPDEDGDRLFIIMPKQAAWIGGFVSIIEEQNEGKKFSEAQIAELEKEFMATFETFTVILSLSKK